MALTENIKHARVNVATGETDHTYYDEVEWADVVEARAASVLPMAKAAKVAALVREAQAAVDAIIKPPALAQAQARMFELLELRIVNGFWTADEEAERNGYKAILDRTRVIRNSEAAALHDVEYANSVEELGDINL